MDIETLLGQDMINIHINFPIKFSDLNTLWQECRHSYLELFKKLDSAQLEAVVSWLRSERINDIEQIKKYYSLLVLIFNKFLNLIKEIKPIYDTCENMIITFEKLNGYYRKELKNMLYKELREPEFLDFLSQGQFTPYNLSVISNIKQSKIKNLGKTKIRSLKELEKILGK